MLFRSVLYFSFTGQIRLGNVLHSAVFALKPAIAEEVIFHFFLLAYTYFIFSGKEENMKYVYIYALLVVPHELLHYPDLFVKSPIMAIIMCVLNSVFFGLPMALLMKKKNLQMAAGMHWFVDFVRFAVGF